MNPTIARMVSLLRRPAVQRWLKITIILAIIVFVGRSLLTSWDRIIHQHWQINWFLLLLGFVFLIGQELSYGIIWRQILQRLGFIVAPMTALRIYLAAEFVRYIPGNVWHVLARIGWAEEVGVPKSFGLASMTIELATKITAAALAFLLSILAWPELSQLHQLSSTASLLFVIVAVPLLIFGLQPRVLSWGLNQGLKLLKREPIAIALQYSDILRITATWMISWCIGGIGFWFVIAAVVPTTLSIPTGIICIGIYALGWDIGFLSFVTPSGLVFREATVTFLLVAAHITHDAAIAGVLAVLGARLVPTIAEILSVGGAYFLAHQEPSSVGIPS